MPHPGGLPMLQEAAEPGFVQMHRTNTGQSVFSSSSATVQPSQHAPRTRNRAQTLGGIPSPYEVPEHNGNTLPRSEVGVGSARPSAGHPISQHHHAGIFELGPHIPPPPAHSPPPLTHSSMEIRARMGDDAQFFSPPGQHTLPRSMGSSRSYSVTSPHSMTSSGGGGGGMRHLKSDGHLPLLETHEEKMVYIQAPLDSSAEASIHSAGSYGAGKGEVVERRPSLERAHHQRHHHHHHHPGGQQPHSIRPTNASVTGSESFSEMTSEPGSAHSSMPQYHLPPFNTERSNQSRGRESVFSETSTELSISSASEKELSPSKLVFPTCMCVLCAVTTSYQLHTYADNHYFVYLAGWDHRGTISEVGVGFHHPSNDSHMDREAFSDVGTSGQLPSNRSHCVFKQV